MTTDILLSIIMPVYNEEKYIADAIESIIKQRINFSLELIIVNDCSTDQTVSIVQQYQTKFPFIKLLHNSEQLRKGGSFIKAYAQAKGRYLHVLDGDDYFVNCDKLQKQVDFLEEHPNYSVVCHNSLCTFPGSEMSFLSEAFSSADYIQCFRYPLFSESLDNVSAKFW